MRKIILYLLFLFFLLSCGGKKKLIQKSQFAEQTDKVARASELDQRETQIDFSLNELIKEKNVSMQQDFTGEVADSSKEATLTVEDLNGKKVYTYTNFKNVTSGHHTSESETSKISDGKLSTSERSERAKNSEIKETSKASGSVKDIDKQKNGKFPWWWLLVILLLVILLLYIAVSYFRKTLNPLRWIGK